MTTPTTSFPSSKSTERVTTVVITHDGRERLARTVPQHAAPLIVVDNASTDGSADLVRTIAPHAQVIELADDVGAVARNIGAQAAETPYVAFAADDSWWAPCSLDLAADVLDTHPEIGVIAARVLVGVDAHLDPFCEAVGRSPLPRFPDVPGTSVLDFRAGAVVVRRSALLDVGGFDAVLELGGEEERVALDMADSGRRLCYLHDVVARHDPASRECAGGALTRRLARNEVLTAVMRRPVRVALRRAWRHVRQGSGSALGVLDAVLRLPRAMARRRTVGSDTETQARILDLVSERGLPGLERRARQA
ncbi:glycosyltransferase [Mumia sp. ZJ430]|uniref:glycosyltransferase family 2 protein n=1 Tax=Mumia sp. ZJ430 TaxID=2708083 RepID=UPI0014241661|nr:glycosyltransferase [Mumia sp. ZJ430]